ncbi:MAG: hypothetical protein LBC80_04155 [Treponema sp.]|jgi:hypothetical protein|nr:hypothetical protein [Treponema sp.]
MIDNENKVSANGDFSLLRQIPMVLRVRAFRLYLSNGQRLVDLWLNGGTAVLGHTPPNLLRELKNSASRGLYAPYPHFTEGRFLKALLKLFPEYSFRIYAVPPAEVTHEKLWRPFANADSPFATEDMPVFIPVLPGIQTWRGGLPMGLCVVAAKSESYLAQLPQNDHLSPVLLAAATRGVYDIIAAKRAKPVFPRLAKTLREGRWQQSGIYLSLKSKPDADEWAVLFRRFLDAGFLLPPAPFFPLILPGELSPGEEVKLAGLL